ncbi:MAG: hypothetical protein QOD72_3159 [Acidimicrobiaceae bacterium]|jgi:hypothetical protein|nr:hypothetical protein [Acidimicrobiaceae bacterium]
MRTVIPRSLASVILPAFQGTRIRDYRARFRSASSRAFGVAGMGDRRAGPGDRSRRLDEGCGGPEPDLASTTSRILLFACDVDEGVRVSAPARGCGATDG